MVRGEWLIHVAEDELAVRTAAGRCVENHDGPHLAGSPSVAEIQPRNRVLGSGLRHDDFIAARRDGRDLVVLLKREPGKLWAESSDAGPGSNDINVDRASAGSNMDELQLDASGGRDNVVVGEDADRHLTERAVGDDRVVAFADGDGAVKEWVGGGSGQEDFECAVPRTDMLVSAGGTVGDCGQHLVVVDVHIDGRGWRSGRSLNETET